MRRLGLGAGALVLGGGAITLALSGIAPASAGLALGLATLVAAGTSVALPLGLLAIGAALGQLTPASADLARWAAVILSGLAAGLVARQADRALPDLAGPRAPGSGVVLCVAALATVLLPDQLLHLLDAHGGALMLHVLVLDGTTGTRIATTVPAILYRPVAAAPLVHGLVWLALLAAYLLLGAALLRARNLRRRFARVGWWAAGALGLLLALGAALDLAGTAHGTLTMPEAAAWARQIELSAGGAVAVRLIDPPKTAILGFASRGVIDTLRLAIGLMLLTLSVAASRAKPHARRAPPAPEAGITGPVLGFALLASAAAAWLLAPGPLAYGAAAATLLIFGSLVGGLFHPRESRLPRDLLWASLAVWAITWLAPLAGWAAGRVGI